VTEPHFELEFVRDEHGNIVEAVDLDAQERPRVNGHLRAVDGSEEPDERPLIRTDWTLQHQGDAAVECLAAEPNVYQQAGHLIRVVRLDPSSATPAKPDGTPEIRRAESETIRELLSHHAHWMRPSPKSGDLQPTHPPRDIAIAVRKRGEWRGIRPLEAIVEAPCLRPDGTVLYEPGYDERLRVLLLPGADFPRIRDEPREEHAAKALKALLAPFAQFPWTRPEDQYVPVAAILTLYARTAILGAVPAVVFDSSIEGSGKTLASGTIHAAYTGRWAESNTYPDDPVELEKSLAGEAMAGSPVVDWDNVEGLIEPPPLLKVLTARDKVRMRVMGTNTKVSLRWRAQVMLNGINLILGRQMARRCLVARMEPKEERPWERGGFTLDLPTWTPANRQLLGVAALTILRGFVCAGRPDMGIRPLGSFEEWSALIPRALAWAGGLDVTVCRRAAGPAGDDPETAALRVILPAWERLGGAHGLGTSEAIRLLYPGGRPPGPNDAPDGWDDLRDALEALCGGRRSPLAAPSPEALRYKLRAMKGRWIAGKCLANRDHSDGKVAVKWVVQSAVATHAPGG
jgi:putative DNA primase/helicase